MKKRLAITIVFLFCNLKISSMSFQSFKQVFEGSSHQEKNRSFLKLVENSIKCTNSFSVMKIGLNLVSIEGFYLEMGVFQGNTINFIAKNKPNQIIYGFDSFDGLPEDWTRDDTNYFAKGCFAIPGLPRVLNNVNLIKGWFNETLPLFKQNLLKDTPIAFLHIDCDIYSSTKTIFDVLGNNIVPGTILVFDELYNYPGFDRHELKAFYEYLEIKNFKVEFLAYNASHEQVAVKILSAK